MKPVLLSLLMGHYLLAQDPLAVFQAAIDKMQQAGRLAAEGKFVQVNELLRAADEEMDQAIAADPDNVEWRARRGVSYSFRSYLPGKAETAIQDLKFASNDAHFGELPEGLRQQVTQRLAALTTAPDRFPGVSEQSSPIVAAASFTVPAGRDSVVPAWVESTVAALKGYPGLLGTHAMASIDHPGMFVVFTWWKDKKALNDFFYGDVHQSWMRQRGVTMSRGGPVPEAVAPSQTAIELFMGAPGGSQINGGVVPPDVFRSVR